MKTCPGIASSWPVLLPVLALLLPTAVGAQTLPTASQVAAQIAVGWNVGNSLEVPGGETGWGNPVVSQTLISAAKKAGFNAIRIPCAWDSHANQSTMTIDAAWLARVKEVVDYAIGQGMYVVLNEHWDGGWLEEHPLYSYQTSVNAKQKAYWTQIASSFKTYDQHLLFAGTNEVHADYGTPTTENITVQQSFNQTFVDAVRATGGNNATRTLVVQTYNTNIQHGLNYFSLPTDSASSRLIVEVHYYDPYDFTLNSSGSCLYWGAPYPTQSACTWAYESYVDSTFAQVKAKWVAAGVPVIIGEYGVATRSGLSLEARAYWLKYVNQAAATNGIKTFYWDNGVQGNNGFALFDRSTGAVVDQAALDAVLQGAGVGNPGASYTLTTTVNGSGSVSRSPTGTSFPGGTTVTLTATPASGYEFSGWTGDVTGTTNPVTIRIVASSTATANFVPQGSGGTGKILREWWSPVYGTTISGLTSAAGYPNSPTGSELLTSIEGPINWADGYGTRIRGYVHPPVSGAYTFWIASDDAGELWLSTSADPALARRIAYVDGYTSSREWSKYASQKSATVNLIAGQKYYLEVLHVEGGGGDNVAVAWQGPGISQSIPSGTYISPYSSSGPTTYGLTVTRSGTGTGTVASTPAGVSCGATCSASYASGTAVTLTATADGGSTFAGWSGACTGTSSCVVTMTAARAVTATFTASTTSYALTVAKSGTGSGTVVSSSGGITCGSTCSASYANGTVVTLTAAAATGSTWGGWSGACTGTASTCVLTMSAARSVTAAFQSGGYTLTVAKGGTGTGRVVSTAGGIDCGTACSKIFTADTIVTLTATPDGGSTFAGWSGACTGTAATCTVTMSAARSVTATFTASTTTTPCANPITFTGNTSTFNTAGAVCFRTSATINGWGCYNMDGRTITVGGVTRTCGQMPLTRSSDGYTYFAITAGTYPWAGLYAW
jgi:endoglucanase